jgi:hypothetical protein
VHPLALYDRDIGYLLFEDTWDSELLLYPFLYGYIYIYIYIYISTELQNFTSKNLFGDINYLLVRLMAFVDSASTFLITFVE